MTSTTVLRSRGRGERKAKVGDIVRFKSSNIPRCYNHLGKVIFTESVLRSPSSYVRYVVECSDCSVQRSGPAAMFDLVESA